MTITEFLLARIAEDELAAKRGRSHPDPTTFARDNYGFLWVQPDRVLAECEAKRRIVEWTDARAACDTHERDWANGCSDCEFASNAEGYDAIVLGHLAEVYADHPDFDPAWRT